MTMNAALMTAIPADRTSSTEGASPAMRKAKNAELCNQNNKNVEGTDVSVQGEQGNFKKTLQKQLSEAESAPKKESKPKPVRFKAEELSLDAAAITVSMQMPTSSETSIKAIKISPVFVPHKQMQSRAVQAGVLVKPAAAAEKKQPAVQAKTEMSAAKSWPQTPPAEKSSAEPTAVEKSPAKSLISANSDKATIKAVDAPATKSPQPQQAAAALSKATVDKAAAAEQTLKDGVLPLKVSAKPESAVYPPTSVAEPTDSVRPDTQTRHGLKSLSFASPNKGKPAATNTSYPAGSKDTASVAEHIGRAFQAAESSSAGTANSVQNVSQIAAAKAIADTAALRPADQIVQTMQLRTFGAEQELRMTLAPQELGAIRLTFRHTEGQVVGLLEVQKDQTRRELEQSVAQLTAAMENAGVQVRRIEIIPWTANTPQQSSRGDLSGQGFDAAAHQQMYRSFEERTPSSTAQHSGAEGLHTQTLNTSSPSPAADSQTQTGLNLFI